MAVLETNVEFENIRQGVFNNTNTRSMEIYIFVDKHNGEKLMRNYCSKKPGTLYESIAIWIFP